MSKHENSGQDLSTTLVGFPSFVPLQSPSIDWVVPPRNSCLGWAWDAFYESCKILCFRRGGSSGGRKLLRESLFRAYNNKQGTPIFICDFWVSTTQLLGDLLVLPVVEFYAALNSSTKEFATTNSSFSCPAAAVERYCCIKEILLHLFLGAAYLCCSSTSNCSVRNHNNPREEDKSKKWRKWIGTIRIRNKSS